MIDAIARAATVLRNGGLVAFPTETVYGLGANALDDAAIVAIYEAKGRPRINPLIVHVPDLEAARTYAVLNRWAETLAGAFWPGPLTLVLNRHRDTRLSKLVSAGLDTVAIRVPNHPVAQSLLRASGLPLAAPSANRSGHLSPTRAEHVRGSLGNRVDMVLDGGTCDVGLESTVVDLSGEEPALLRPGFLDAATLSEVLSTRVIVPDVESDAHAPRSPGRLLRHYAPRARLRLNADEPVGDNEVLLGFGTVENAHLNLSPSGNLAEAAANLFAMLHELDALGVDSIAVSPIPDRGLGEAINDRLRRGAEAR